MAAKKKKSGNLPKYKVIKKVFQKNQMSAIWGVKGQIFPIDNALANFKLPYLGNGASEAKKE